MPWDKNNYPDTYKNMDREVRNKAIEVANSVLEDGYEKGRAIAIGAKQAKQWAENHTKTASQERHLVPHNGGWAIKKEKDSQAIETHENKENALKRAKEIAGNNKATLIIHKQDGSIQDKIDYA